MDDKPYRVVKYTHQKIGRGGATVKLKVRSLENGTLSDKTLNSSAKVDDITTNKKSLQYLYDDGDNSVFMDPETYDQIEIPNKLVSDQLVYIKEGESVNVLFWEDKPLSIDIAPKVTLIVKETPPGVKGNSATNIYKPATMDNGLQIKVPLFIKVGDKIRVDTRTGEYVERVN